MIDLDRVKNLKEPTCKLYGPDEVFIYEIPSQIELNEIRIQIKNQDLDGYYVITENNERIELYANGQLSHWPKGFYDWLDDQLIILIGF